MISITDLWRWNFIPLNIKILLNKYFNLVVLFQKAQNLFSNIKHLKTFLKASKKQIKIRLIDLMTCLLTTQNKKQILICVKRNFTTICSLDRRIFKVFEWRKIQIWYKPYCRGQIKSYPKRKFASKVSTTPKFHSVTKF